MADTPAGIVPNTMEYAKRNPWKVLGFIVVAGIILMVVWALAVKPASAAITTKGQTYIDKGKKALKTDSDGAPKTTAIDDSTTRGL